MAINTPEEHFQHLINTAAYNGKMKNLLPGNSFASCCGTCVGKGNPYTFVRDNMDRKLSNQEEDISVIHARVDKKSPSIKKEGQESYVLELEDGDFLELSWGNK